MEPWLAREQLYGVFADPGIGLEETVDRALEVGSAYLGLPIGFLTRIDAGIQEIVQSTGDHPLIQPGGTCPLEEAYCRRTVELDSPLAVRDAEASDAIAQVAIDAFDLGAYIGARVEVDGAVHGTVCFAAGEARGASFTDAESAFVELLARLVGHALERRKYERALADREAEVNERREVYRAVIDASFDLVFRVDDTGRFTYVSEPIRELLGYGPERYVGEPITTMLPDESATAVATGLYERVLAGETVEHHFFPLDHRSGDRVYVDLRVTPIYASDVPEAERTAGDVVGAQGMARDSTDRHRGQRLIKVLNRVLRHNLRNDMNVIEGYAELLAAATEGEDREMAERIGRTADRLMSLSETARQLERNLEAPAALGPTDVVPIVERVASRARQAHPEVTIEVDAPPAATARAAPRLETALRELVANAAKHAGAAPRVEIGVRADDAGVTIRVADDGPGLPEQERAILVAGDETPLSHGSGLGLWVVHWVVGSLDGQLRLAEADAGAAIEVRLRAP